MKAKLLRMVKAALPGKSPAQAEKVAKRLRYVSAPRPTERLRVYNQSAT
jgi:hypothetical protein